MLVLVLVLCLFGCEAIETTETTESKTEIKKAKDTNILIWTDKKTGVQYIIYSYGGMGGGITPRLNADGTLYVESEETQ